MTDKTLWHLAVCSVNADAHMCFGKQMVLSSSVKTFTWIWKDVNKRGTAS